MQYTKTLDLSEVELKVEGPDEEGTFSGYASKFNSVDLVGDTFVPGAWTKAIEGLKNLPIFFNHNSNEVPIGKYTKVEQNARGLKVEGQLLMTIPKAKEVYEAMKAGIVSGLSVGFELTKDGYDMKDDGGLLIKEVSRLREVSICTFPCEPKAQITAVKSEDLNTIRDIEKFLRDLGLSKSQTLAFISKAKAVFADDARREPEQKAETTRLDELNRLNSYLKEIKNG